MRDTQLYEHCVCLPLWCHPSAPTLGSSIHYSPFGLCFHGKCKNYLQAKPAGSQCQLLA
ncbi:MULTISPECIES: hypothetical protein [Wolbachia]|uniref:hypothetical protein n=1 Tax=Wolbachia TaxID=953 RepID=UPI001C70B0B5|nr:hypothetical protein [Wolbachia pipientis]